MADHRRVVQELNRLDAERTHIETEIKQVVLQLQDKNMGGMQQSLVDQQGFPRNDVDVHATRILRNTLATLNTDHKRIMTQLEINLHDLHRVDAEKINHNIHHSSAQTAAAAAPLPCFAEPNSTKAAARSTHRAFAVFDSVAANGPAAIAGIRTGDMLERFGDLHESNHDNFRALARYTQRCIGSEIVVAVSRRGDNGTAEQLQLILVPGEWDGPGLLGCHVRPLN